MLPTQYQQFIHLSRYSRWKEDLKRRETWDETIDRVLDFFGTSINTSAFDWSAISNELRSAILSLEVMPSMRVMMTAGEALGRDNVAAYNCAYVAVDNQRVFDETMYVLMCGTGVGFSVERQFIQNLPTIAEEFNETDTTIVVPDSKIGWSKSFRELISLLYSGQIPKWDTSKVRPAGARLKTFGGRASGPAPLEELFKFSVDLFKEARGRKLNSIECHDLMCKIAQIVVVGGVRRSAMISLSNLTDERMRKAKNGRWWDDSAQRALANNSVSYTEKPDVNIFLKEWGNLYESRSGERGIFYREAAREAAGRSGRRDTGFEFGTNPCSEIILRSKQFCNLTEVVVRPQDTLESLKRKVRLATILGTFQATLTNFRYLSSSWKKNTEEEALLGVSLTGIMDHPVMSAHGNPNPIGLSDEEAFEIKSDELIDWLQELKEVAIETNKEWADKLGINQAAAITCVKPSGTVSQLVDSASGIHPRYSRFYIRRVRGDKKDPLSELLINQGVPHEEDQMNPSAWVFSFPVKAPEESVDRDSTTAMEQLRLWKTYQESWCEHKPSITVYYKDEDFMDIGAWVYNNFNAISGISFLPHSNHIYPQAPYEEITEDKYKELEKAMPEIDWSKLSDYEKEDHTTGTQELACTGGSCEII